LGEVDLYYCNFYRTSTTTTTDRRQIDRIAGTNTISPQHTNYIIHPPLTRSCGMGVRAHQVHPDDVLDALGPPPGGPLDVRLLVAGTPAVHQVAHVRERLAQLQVEGGIWRGNAICKRTVCTICAVTPQCQCLIRPTIINGHFFAIFAFTALDATLN